MSCPERLAPNALPHAASPPRAVPRRGHGPDRCADGDAGRRGTQCCASVMCRFPGVPGLRRRRRGRWRRGVSDGARAGAKFGGFWGDPARFGASLRRTPPRHGRRRSVFPLAQRRVGRRGHFRPRRAALCRAGGHSEPSPGRQRPKPPTRAPPRRPSARPVGLRSGSRFVRAAGPGIGTRIRNIVKFFRRPERWPGPGPRRGAAARPGRAPRGPGNAGVSVRQPDISSPSRDAPSRRGSNLVTNSTANSAASCFGFA